MSIVNLHTWSGLCDCGQAKYNNNPHCTSCMANEAKKSRTDERKSEKQQKDLAKALERQREPKQQPKQVSKRQQQEAAELSRIKKELIAKGGKCIACNTTYDLTLSHVISRRHKQYSTNPVNLVLLCLSDHELYEHDKSYFAAIYPNAWKQKLERAKQLSLTHYEQLKDKANG